MSSIVEAPGAGADRVAEALVASARDLAPALRARAEADPDARRLPAETVADLHAAGLFKVLQARRCGGFELDIATHLDVVSALAEGCPSTAWVAGVGQAHAWLLGHFPAAAQDDVYEDPDTLVSAVIRPRGRAVEVSGGYRLSGFWPFGSGAEHAGWLMLGAVVVDRSGDVLDEGDLLLPTAEADLQDDWYVDGLRATGSCSIVVDDVFVPEHRFLSLVDLGRGESPGRALHADPGLFSSAHTPVLAIALTGAAIGTARAALAEFISLTGNRTVPYVAPPQADGRRPPDVAQSEWSGTHRLLGDAAVTIDEGALLLGRSAELIDDHARRGAPMARERRAIVRMDSAQAVRRCLEAVEALYLATGGSGLRSTNRIGHALRDLQAMNMHALLTLDTTREMYGRVLLGLDASMV